MFHLGRIEQAALQDTTFQIPPQFSLDRFLGNAWHLIRGTDGPQDVVIRFAKQVARNVAEVRWHQTQTTTFLPDGQLEFCVTVDGLEEISWWILGYGDRAEVLHPPELRERILRHARDMAARYDPATPDASATGEVPLPRN